MNAAFAYVLSLLGGWKTYLAAAGLIGLGVYQASNGDLETGMKTMFQGAGLVGLRHAVTTSVPVIVVEDIPPTK